MELMKGEMYHEELLDLIIIFPLKSSSHCSLRTKKIPPFLPPRCAFIRPPNAKGCGRASPVLSHLLDLEQNCLGRAALAWWKSRWAPSSYDRSLAPSAQHGESLTQLKIQLFESPLKERYFWPGCQGFIKSFSVNQSNFPLTSLFIFPPHTHTVSAWLILSQG